MVTVARSTGTVPVFTTRRCGASEAVVAFVFPARYCALRATTGGGVGTVSWSLMALSWLSLFVFTFTQSSCRMPPVSPEFGFQDQKVQLKSLAPWAPVVPR